MVKKKIKKAAKKKKSTSPNPFVANVDSQITKTICSNISKLQKGYGTQEAFANYVGIPLPYCKGVLQKRFAPSHAVMCQISKLFKVSTDWIYGLSEGEV
jgi:hypothetical protein